MRRFLAPLLAFPFILVFFAVRAGSADPIDPFVGEWKGIGITDGLATSVGFADRDVDLKVEKSAQGFHITWKSIQDRVDDSSQGGKLRTTSVKFVPVERGGLYVMEGATAPLNEHAYSWAHVTGRTLTVHSIMVSKDGRLEHQKYVRTVNSGDAMELLYTRWLDEEVIRTVLAEFKRR